MKLRARRWRLQFREGTRKVHRVAPYAAIIRWQNKHGTRMVKVAIDGMEFDERLKEFPSDELIAKLMLVA